MTVRADASGRPDSPSQTILISVSNSGVEIPADQIGRVFDKFYRVPNGDPHKHGGTGLGLALVKKLVLHLGGGVCAESSNGQTRFMIELPTASNASSLASAARPVG
ncbi:MAG: HAMP domain-containing histidine kinase [Leptolyngbyaceae cyanobacterium RU_5_1]|nr:HAMP domain-containing histidine kinase [Leptolyngbyaceae cyanobacterium RU_5_1]